MDVAGIKCVLLDIEGTMTSLSFVQDVLFPYARANVEKYLSENWENPRVTRILRDLLNLDNQEPHLESHLQSCVSLVNFLMDKNSKVAGLKELQGYIWHAGYEKGELAPELYPDVLPNLKRFKETLNLKLAIYSSGSIGAQKLLFSHTTQGDCTPMFDGFFDLQTAGSKLEGKSYVNIAHKLSLSPREIVFLTDVITEAEAAASVEMKAVLVMRPGNAPIPTERANRFTQITTFDTLFN